MSQRVHGQSQASAGEPGCKSLRTQLGRALLGAEAACWQRGGAGVSCGQPVGSERHAAYACGLGTFGLSRGIITQKGMAGRVASMIVDSTLETDERPYSGVYDYCVKCGACAKRCPAGAITVERGKNNALCSRYLDRMGERYAPRYGCGKCQTGVPCEHKIPGQK